MSGPEFTLVALPPDQRERVEHAISSTLRRARGCVHLSPRKPAFICVQHPGTIRCYECSARHIETHTNHEEHDCDVCGGPLDPDGFDLHTAMLRTIATDVSVNLGRGHRTKVRLVFAIGWGTCWPCHVDLSAQTWEVAS